MMAGSNITGYEQVRIGTVEHRLSNHYDGLGRLTAVETPAGIVKYKYDGAGRLTREENLGADVNTVYTYSLFNEITGIDIFNRESVLPKAVRARVAIEAASTFGWERYAGLDGVIIGMKGFGASAPAGELFKRFGFTVEAVVSAAKSVVSR